MTIPDSAGANAVGHKDPLADHWNELSSLLCSWWGKLTEEDVTRIAGHKERLVRLLQDKYGYAPDRATREVDQRLQEYQDNTPSLAQSAATPRSWRASVGGTAWSRSPAPSRPPGGALVRGRAGAHLRPLRPLAAVRAPARVQPARG